MASSNKAAGTFFFHFCLWFIITGNTKTLRTQQNLYQLIIELETFQYLNSQVQT